jgi:transposase
MSIQVKQLDFCGQNIYVGIDVHKKHFTVSIQVDSQFYKTFNQPPVAEVLVNYLVRNFPGANYYATYEAGFSGFWLQEHLISQGVNCIVVNACDVPTTDREKKQKRDPLDSRKLCRALKNGELNAIYVLDKQTQQDRSLIRTRQKIIGNQTRCRNRIKGLLYYYGIEYPEQFKHSGTHWSKRFMCWLEKIELGKDSGNSTLKLLIKEALSLRELIFESDKLILKLSQQERYTENVRLLLSVPGLGRLTSMIMLTEIENINRFKSLDHFCAYVGLIPNVYCSGESEKVGDISKRGNKHLRSYIVESSWVAIRNDPALALKYHQLCSRMVGNKAIIRIARKLLNRIRYVLLNKEKYKFSLAA